MFYDSPVIKSDTMFSLFIILLYSIMWNQTETIIDVKN